MDTEGLDRWAEKYMGGDAEDIALAAESEWYTGSVTAAFAIADNVVRTTGAELELELSKAKGKCEVMVGGIGHEGSYDDAARLILQACYDYTKGKSRSEDESD